MEQYSSGRRGAPAKGIGRETGARVQISPAPPLLSILTISLTNSFFIAKKNRLLSILL